MSGTDNDKSPETEEVQGRRSFLKLGLVGAGAAAAAAGGITIAKRMEGIPQDGFPVPIGENFKTFSQKNLIFTKAISGEDPELHRLFKDFESGPPRDAPGYTQLDRALQRGGWALAKAAAPYAQACQPDSGLFGWKQEHLASNRYVFESRQQASAAIKRAARIYGADLAGITQRDPRWDYSEFYDFKTGKTRTWDDFPFEPKTVIVLAVEMDYHAMATAPSWIASGTVGYAYSMMVLVASSVAKFLQCLGYKAVAAGNDLAISVAYGIAAGLGEGARNGALIVPRLGPRIRLCKVFTDLEFVEYDKPRAYGVTSFCENCKRCADSCPSHAISFDDKRSFEPTWGKPRDWSGTQTGILKWYSQSEKCFRFWLENGGDCGSCITSCPYNKPDFWHHRLVDASNVVAPGPMHKFMRFMDEVFGYGKVDDPEAIRRFWKAGYKS
jgi:reductive dehalogenase